MKYFVITPHVGDVVTVIHLVWGTDKGDYVPRTCEFSKKGQFLTMDYADYRSRREAEAFAKLLAGFEAEGYHDRGSEKEFG